MKKEENQAINRFIDENELIITEEFPSVVPFPPKVYYKTPEGLYMRIESKGTPVDFAEMPDDVFVSYEGLISFKTSWTEYNGGSRYWIFQYTNPYSYYGSSLICEGVLIPLRSDYGIGHDSAVSLIIPSNLGTADQQQYVEPLFYRNVKYTVNPRKG